MRNRTHGQWGIMVNTADRDGAPWGMGHMGNGKHGQRGYHGTWAPWGMGHMGTWANMDNGAHGYT